MNVPGESSDSPGICLYIKYPYFLEILISLIGSAGARTLLTFQLCAFLSLYCAVALMSATQLKWALSSRAGLSRPPAGALLLIVVLGYFLM